MKPQTMLDVAAYWTTHDVGFTNVVEPNAFPRPSFLVTRVPETFPYDINTVLQCNGETVFGGAI